VKLEANQNVTFPLVPAPDLNPREIFQINWAQGVDILSFFDIIFIKFLNPADGRGFLCSRPPSRQPVGGIFFPLLSVALRAAGASGLGPPGLPITAADRAQLPLRLSSRPFPLAPVTKFSGRKGQGEKITFPFAHPCFIIEASNLMRYSQETPWISLPA
jgi:hypothetical protein